VEAIRHQLLISPVLLDINFLFRQERHFLTFHCYYH
jgi:hypothetical protein